MRSKTENLNQKVSKVHQVTNKTKTNQKQILLNEYFTNNKHLRPITSNY